MKYFNKKHASFVIMMLLNESSGMHTDFARFPHHSWATLDTNMISVTDTFEQESLAELTTKDLTKKLRSTLKEALKFESEDSELGTIKAMEKAKSVRNVEATLSKKINDQVKEKSDLDDLSSSMIAVAKIQSTIFDMEERLDFDEQDSSTSLQNSIRKLHLAAKNNRQHSTVQK